MADQLGICVKDDKVNAYIDKNPYLWSRIKDVKYTEARNVYEYRIGNKPLSTQHKTKGLEYNNVLVILKSNWSSFNFESLFVNKRTKESVVKRTKDYSMFVVLGQRRIWPFIIHLHQSKS